MIYTTQLTNIRRTSLQLPGVLQNHSFQRYGFSATKLKEVT